MSLDIDVALAFAVGMVFGAVFTQLFLAWKDNGSAP